MRTNNPGFRLNINPKKIHQPENILLEIT